jgi:ABC-type transport system substrate-binding protein
MKPRSSVLLAVLLPALLAIALVVAACGGVEETTTTAQATTTTAEVTTTTAEVTTTTAEVTTTTAQATTTTLNAQLEGGTIGQWTTTVTFDDGATAAASIDLPNGTHVAQGMECVVEFRDGGWVVVEVK